MHSAVGTAAIRFIALTGVRRGECESLRWDEVDANGTCVALGETKTGPFLRPLSRVAFAILERQAAVADYVFAASADGSGYQGANLEVMSPAISGNCRPGFRGEVAQHFRFEVAHCSDMSSPTAGR